MRICKTVKKRKIHKQYRAQKKTKKYRAGVIIL